MKSSTQRSQALRARIKASPFKRHEVIIIDIPDAIAELIVAAAKINKKYQKKACVAGNYR